MILIKHCVCALLDIMTTHAAVIYHHVCVAITICVAGGSLTPQYYHGVLLEGLSFGLASAATGWCSQC